MKIRFIKNGEKTSEEYEAAIKTLKDELNDSKHQYLNNLIERNLIVERLNKQLKDCQNDLNRGFPITEEEDLAINKWMKDHSAIKHNRACGCGGGSYSFVFIPTGLGTIGYVSCTCGDEFVFREIE